MKTKLTTGLGRFRSLCLALALGTSTAILPGVDSTSAQSCCPVSKGVAKRFDWSSVGFGECLQSVLSAPAQGNAAVIWAQQEITLEYNWNILGCLPDEPYVAVVEEALFSRLPAVMSYYSNYGVALNYDNLCVLLEHPIPAKSDLGQQLLEAAAIFEAYNSGLFNEGCGRKRANDSNGGRVSVAD